MTQFIFFYVNYWLNPKIFQSERKRTAFGKNARKDYERGKAIEIFPDAKRIKEADKQH